jgi:hypothetical protein
MSVDPKMSAMATSAREAGNKIIAAAAALEAGDAPKAVEELNASVTNLEAVAKTAGVDAAAEEEAKDEDEDEAAANAAAAMGTDGTYVGRPGEGPIYVAWKNGKNADGTDADENAPEPVDKSLGGGKKKKRRGGKSQRKWKKMKKGGRQSKKRR